MKSSGSGVTFSMRWQDLFHGILAHRLILMASITLGVLLGFLYLRVTTPVYESTAVVEVGTKDSSTSTLRDSPAPSEDESKNSEFLRTVEQTLQSNTLLDRVIENHHLLGDPRFLPPNSPAHTRKQQVNALSSMVEVKLRRGTRLIELTTYSTDPRFAHQLANWVIEEYIKQNSELQEGNAENVFRFLLDEAKRLKEKLQQSEQALQMYRESTQLVSLDETQNIVVEKLKDLNTKLTQAKTERLRLEADYQLVEKVKDSPDALMTVPSIANETAVADLKKQLHEEQSQIALLQERYKPAHPKMIQAMGKLRDIQDALERAVLAQPKIIQSRYEMSLASEQSLADALHEQEKLALELNKKSIQYKVLERDLTSDKDLYEAVLKKLKETQVLKGLGINSIRVVDAGFVADEPIKPNARQTMVLGAFLGGLAGLSVAIGLFLSNTSIKTVDEAESISELPVLAAVPRSAARMGGPHHSLVLERDPNAPIAEAFRSLRATLGLLEETSQSSAILFTSAIPSEGKSLCAANYALALAQQGYRTLLVDLDLRRPMVHRIFSLSDEAPGISDYLSGSCLFPEVLTASEYENLTLVTAGTQRRRPAEKLAGASFENFFQSAQQHFHRIVFDTAPVLSVSDALPVMKIVPHLCLVIHAGRTPRRAVVRALDIVRRAKAVPVGVILNQLPRKTGFSYYYYYSPQGVYGESYLTTS